MTTQATDVRHDHGIVREVAEVYKRYADTVSRLRALGTDEDAISEDFYRAAVKVYADTILFTEAFTRMSDIERRETLASLATITLRWARKVRIGTAPEVHVSTMREGEVQHDT